jgi:hypothetical protein
MLPLAHIYVASGVLKRVSDLLIVGSVLPDIATTSLGRIDRDMIHYSPAEFYDFVNKNYPDLRDLAIGVKLHSPVNKGADFYSDDDQTGYAKINGKKLVSKVARLTGMKEDDQAAIVLAHNFIEAGIDLNLTKNHRHLPKLYRSALENTDIDRVALCLADYLKSDPQTINKELAVLFDFVGPDSFENVDNMAEKTVMDLMRTRMGIEVDKNMTVDILKEAVKITEGDYLEFLDSTTERMRKDFEYLNMSTKSE